MARIGVLLSGCGVNDGSEIHEAVLTMLALDEVGAERVCLAPDRPQRDVVNHLSGEPAPESRNVLVEAARIARGEIHPLAAIGALELDGLILPGGFGAAKNLSDFAVAGAQTEVLPAVEKLLRELHAAGRPIGAICIAPVILARVFGSLGVKVTIGNDPGVARVLEGFGACHIECLVDDVVVDEEHRLVTTPAYMLGPGLKEIRRGIEKLVQRVVALVG
jgi:enhancing lycopene biosynthesis protein 2